MMALDFALLFVLFLLPSCFCVHDLDAKYSFRRNLHPRYTLYWNYNPTLRNISFAVRVQTTGWVGFGISPNGGMVGSDVIIGGVQNGRSYFNVSIISCHTVLYCMLYRIGLLLLNLLHQLIYNKTGF